MRKALVIQLVIFVVIAVVGTVYVGARYVRLPSLLGFGEYTVFVDAPNTGGVFTNAQVSYRGLPVGRVGDISLTDTGARIALTLDDDAPKVPANARAVVANRSAIGEQYVDLRPTADSEDFLSDGDVITATDEDLPIKVEDLLRKLDELNRSVPLEPLRITVNELGDAVAGRGDDLSALTDSLIKLSEEGVATLPQLKKLIRDGAVVLNTQAEQSGEVISFSRDLRTVTEALRDSDSDLRGIIDSSTDFGRETSTLVERSGGNLTSTVDNLADTFAELRFIGPSVRMLLQLIAPMAAGAESVAPGDGTIHFGLVFETNNPPLCTLGYEGTQEILRELYAQDPSFDEHEQDFPINRDAHCAAPQGSVTAVRGSQNAQFADPRVPQPWDNNPKIDPDRLNLTVAATQLAMVTGMIPR